MADAAVTFLLENLQKLVLDQVHLISDAEYELSQLRNELEIMKSFLEDSAYKRVKGKVFKTLEKQIREVVYIAEDTIDSCISQAAAERSSFSLRSYLSTKRLGLAREVKTLREEKVKPVFDDARFRFAALPISDELDTRTKATIDQIRKVNYI
ncbi:hypothetical protein CDL12_11302 [Handroanthus impetiginosus]|uniref:Disease resistance N-terminal domain-containing protein n=1 Tax=Handroanthus impetiginosus TaxID=429701 RepID=A0A2G9HEW4_9LAMI|nr:hypothetical protein CDL12_11302 [Handroanthus impetiginosus]